LPFVCHKAQSFLNVISFFLKLTSCLNCKWSRSQGEKNLQLPNKIYGSGRSVVRLARLLGVQEVGSSNLPAPTIFLRMKSSMEGPQVFTIDPLELAGENFVAWTKGNRNSPAPGCAKKFILQKPPAKPALYGRVTDNYFGWHRRC
jgi:hypothetical protein